MHAVGSAKTGPGKAPLPRYPFAPGWAYSRTPIGVATLLSCGILAVTLVLAVTEEAEARVGILLIGCVTIAFSSIVTIGIGILSVACRDLGRLLLNLSRDEAHPLRRRSRRSKILAPADPIGVADRWLDGPD